MLPNRTLEISLFLSQPVRQLNPSNKLISIWQEGRPPTLRLGMILFQCTESRPQEASGSYRTMPRSLPWQGAPSWGCGDQAALQGLRQQWTSPVSQLSHELTPLILNSIFFPLGLTQFLPAQRLYSSVQYSFSALSWPRIKWIFWGQIFPLSPDLWIWEVKRCWHIYLQSNLT